MELLVHEPAVLHLDGAPAFVPDLKRGYAPGVPACVLRGVLRRTEHVLAATGLVATARVNDDVHSVLICGHGLIEAFAISPRMSISNALRGGPILILRQRLFRNVLSLAPVALGLDSLIKICLRIIPESRYER